jgi:hypothetical protein
MANNQDARAALVERQILEKLAARWEQEADEHPVTYNNQHDPEIAFYNGKLQAAEELREVL